MIIDAWAVEALGLDDEAKTMFLAGNARRVFKLAR
jgi:predicted TIM-barrel fold metal-dependent hydrolase